MPPVFLTLDDEALKVFCDYDYRVSEAAQKAMLPSHAALLNKSPGKVGRIAGLLWVLDYVTDKTGDGEVGVEFVQRAIRLVEHLDRYAMQFNVEANQTAKEKCMWRLHRNAGKTKDWIPQRILRNNCSPAEKERFDAAEMQEMLGGVTQVASFHTELEIDRSDYGVGVGSWAAALVVGHEVTIEIAVEANR